MSRRRWARQASVVGACLALVVTGVAATRAAGADRQRAQPAIYASASTPTPLPTLRAVPLRRAESPRPRVYVVGDSLTVGTEPWLRPDLRRRGWTLTGVSAQVGRPVSEGLAVLRAHRTRLPRTIVIALGTNDLGAGRQTVRGWLRTARAILGHRRIVWVNLCLASAADPRLAAYRQLNASLDAYAPRFGVVVAHWCSYATARGIRPGPDGIHYSPSGYRSRAAFYARAIATTR